ncbi:unnamed protein product [Cylicocyclus nassatus]|uniref:Uncharacterized protein n=1 Tax=Cylicocyclus nassatus TaxID=53992 RepID=A0AA36DP41_CYLNA|nr:unnamed protein product [Cylicocyclus nassatus]
MDVDGQGRRNIRIHAPTIECPPMVDFYRNSVDVVRPSMDQLIHGNKVAPEETKIDLVKEQDGGPVEQKKKSTFKSLLSKFSPSQKQNKRVKFGWVEGVLIRCVLNIFGVMLYIRVSWVAGQAGLILGSVIILIAGFVTFITAISMCAICTNGVVKGGGAYFLISRSLGPEFGGSIGVIYSIANAVAAAMYVVGFGETLRDVLKEHNAMFASDLWVVRIIGWATCVLLIIIIFIGTGFESKMQIVLLVVLSASLVNFWIGSALKPSETVTHRGGTGYSLNTLNSNLMPHFRGETFISLLAIYFPAATGIMGGANISGDLADPQRAIPLGTLSAIGICTVVYIATLWITGSTCVRDADGVFPPMWNGTSFVPPECAATKSCEYGLLNYFQIVEMESLFGPLITAGIFAAGLSSALASLISAPKIFQAVCRDRLFPKIEYFAKGYGKNDEPRRAYAFAFIIAMGVISIGELNAIAPFISNFFLATYTLINYACFDASFADSPGFRPGFRFYNMWASLFGALLCIAMMFIMSWITALVTFVCFAAIFIYILYRKPDVNWGSSAQAHNYNSALTGMIRLSHTEDHVKNYRPQILVLSGNVVARPSLIDFAYSITKGSSLMICGHIVPHNTSERVYSNMREMERQLSGWLRKRHVKAFYVSVANVSLRAGAQSLLQVCGLGHLKPNIILIGFKSNWHRCCISTETLNDLNDYFGTIQDAFDANMAVCVFRNEDLGLDLSRAIKRSNTDDRKLLDVYLDDSEDEESSERSSWRFAESNGIQETNGKEVEAESSNTSKDIDDDEDKNRNGTANGEVERYKKFENNVEAGNGRPHLSSDHKGSSTSLPTEEDLLASMSKFQKKIKKGTIDVWWLYDDGGLTLLLPHLLRISKSYLEGAKLRIFTLSTCSHTTEEEQHSMAVLLEKFRINFSDVSIISDIGCEPKPETLSQWENFISPFIASADAECLLGMTTQSELDAQKPKTYRQLRAAELLREHSSDADLIVMTLPVPRKGMVSASLYLSWLDIMTRGVPPTLLVRGNQTSVLTFYS